ncbi:MAG: PfkB family carbohydrate kinase, partial [Candidatus Kapaibacteriota bacterium]
EAEAVAFTEKDNHHDAFEALKLVFPHVVMTKGKDGAEIFYEEKQASIPAYMTTAVDTTGAGDMFAGAFLYGITQGLSIHRSGHLASMASSRVVSQFGARLKESPKELFQTILESIA